MSKETIDVYQLKIFLESHTIPSVKQQPKTFLEIARQPHYENVISNIYAFYFDPHEEHGLGHLFINAFIKCIQESLKSQAHEIASTDFLDDFQEFVIETEYGTEDKGRIDLLLYNDDQAIIIENKIYHQLANNLNDYWKTAETKERKANMVGVLLTLKKHSGSLHPKFVNVLHLDFLKEVMANIGNHLMEASEKYVTFLKDLYQNIENMSTKQLSDENFKFYIENQDKILDAVKFNDQAKDHIKTQIVDAWNSQEDLKVDPPTKNTYKFYSYREIKKEGVKDLYFCIYFDKLLSGQKEVWISLYLTGDYFKKYFLDHTPENEENNKLISEIKQLIRSYGDKGIKLYNNHKEKRDWEYIAGQTYKLSDNQIANLQETIEGFIKQGEFIKLFDQLVIQLEKLSKAKNEKKI